MHLVKHEKSNLLRAGAQIDMVTVNRYHSDASVKKMSEKSVLRRTARHRRVMLFDPSVSGHHPTYIAYVVQAWQREVTDVELWVSVSPDFARLYPEIYALGEHERIFFHECRMPSGLGSKLPMALSVVEGPMREWFALKQAIREVRPSTCLVMYVDRLLAVPLMLGLRQSCPLWGIYFRPSFHYSKLGHALRGKRRRLRAARQVASIKAIARWGNIQGLFVLDPFAAEAVRSIGQSVFHTIHLPDPVSADPVVEQSELRGKLGIPHTRKVALLFGSLGPRKGTIEVLRSLPFLPIEQQSNLCVLLVGRVPASATPDLHRAIDTARRCSNAQILLVDDYVAEADVMDFFGLADVVLATYDEHVGMSGIQLRAAQAGKPILASNYGLLSELTHRFRLGLTVNPRVPRDVARGLRDLLVAPAAHIDKRMLAEFVAANSVESFTDTIISHLT